MSKAFFACVLLLAAAGCAGPTIATREVHRDASWFVRLDTYEDAKAAAGLAYEHPVNWSEADLSAILRGLLVQERIGLLDQKMPPKALFAPEEIRQLAPQLQAAFRLARPTEWVAVYLEFSSRSPVPEVTSGGFFVKGGALHVVVANHREWLPPGPDGADAVRGNPMRSLGGRGSILTFDPPRFVLATQANWMGGTSGAPAGELLLDYKAFLGDVKPPVAASVAAGAGTDLKSVPAPSEQAAKPSGEVARLKQKLEEQDLEIAQLKTRLKEFDLQKKEVERLRQKSDEQETQIEQLKARLSELDAPKKKPPAKKPAR
jgi:hypothetical protein